MDKFKSYMWANLNAIAFFFDMRMDEEYDIFFNYDEGDTTNGKTDIY